MRHYLTILLVFFSSLVFFNSCHVDDNAPVSQGSTDIKFADNLSAKWPRVKFPLNVQVSTDFTNEEIMKLKIMEEEWDNAVSDVSFFITPPSQIAPTDYSNIELYQDGIIGIYKSDNWFDDVDENALAVTQYFATKVSQGGVEYLELYHADIIVNYRDFSFSIDPKFGEYDLPSVVLHELGHLLGLKHENDLFVDSIMHPYMLTQTIERVLYPADEYEISSNYPSEDSEGGSSQMAITSKKISGEKIRGIIKLTKSGHCTHKQYLIK